MRAACRPARRQRGFSLVELMISLVIGLVVIGAVLAAYLSSGFSSRNTAALTQITEDATVALNILRSQVAMVGYSRPLSADTQGIFTKAYTQEGLRGCDGKFTSLTGAIGTLTCTTVGADAIAIAYEADVNNSAESGGVPLDCLGNALSPTGAGAGQYYLAYSRFYLDQPSGASFKSLYCRGPGSTSSQALVENVEDMQITYGVPAPAVAGEDKRVGYYANATTVGMANMPSVVAVRICLVVASATEVMDTETDYQPCDPFGGPVTPTDKRMYRAFTTTIVMPNRMGILLQKPVTPPGTPP